MKRSVIASLIAFSLTGAASVQAEPLIAQADLPAIPLSVTDPVRKPVATSSVAPEPESAKAVKKPASVSSDQIDREVRKLQAQLLEDGQKTPEKGENIRAKAARDSNGVVVAEPGVNQLLKISRGHPNRILLPFSNPKIQTTSADAQIKTEDSVVFVATNSQRPVTLFASPQNDPRMALSLTLVPGAVPPSQYEIRLPDTMNGVPTGRYFMGNPAAEKWEKKGDYTRALVNVFAELARENLPHGYRFRLPSAQDIHTCASGSQVEYQVAQIVEGHHLVVQVVVGTNKGSQPIEVIGSDCAAEGVVAAAEWPHSVLEPGQKTEMYVAFEREPVAKPKTRRPSAIGGN